MNLELVTKYASSLSAIASAIQIAKGASAEASSVNTANTANVTDAVRQYAVESAANGDDPADCRTALQLALTAAEIKSASSYGNSFAGYRAMLEAEQSVEGVNMKDAQTFIASDEVKAKTAARKDLMKAIKYATADDLRELAELAEANIPQDAKAAKARAVGVKAAEAAEASETAEAARNVA